MDQKINLNMYEGSAVLKTSLYMNDISHTSKDDYDGSIVNTGMSSAYVIKSNEI